MSLKRILNEDSVEGSRQIRRDYHNGHQDEFSDVPLIQGQDWDSLLTGFQNLLDGENVYPDDDTALGLSGNISEPTFDIEEDVWELMTQSNDSITIDSMLSSGDERNNHMDLDVIDVSHRLDGSEASVAGFASQDDGDHQIVCYGMVHRAAVKVVGVMAEIDKRLTANCSLGQGPRGFQEFKIQTEGATTNLIFPGGGRLGILDQHSAEALKPLLEQPKLEFNAFAEINAIRSTIGRARKSTDAVIRVNININGPKTIAQKLGQDMSNRKVWLQRPLIMTFPYHNPHVIEFPGLEYHQAQALEAEIATPTSQKKQSFEDLQRSVAEVYSTLGRDKDLLRVEGDRRLKTQLLPHQEEALDFMTQRETGEISEKYRLWKSEDKNGQKQFVHKITNHRSQLEPEEKGGGVLADEMGMGKTLSILALVMSTLEKARDWALSHAQSEPPSVAVLNRRSRATLIVVSSALLINGWFAEIKRHLHEGTFTALKTIRWHGSNRKLLQEDLMDADIVITTYNTLATEYKSKSSLLHDIDWYRLVLDEAHIIRRQATVFYKACYDLTAPSRWCLTGTPIQNRLEDIGTLFAFIRARPFHSLAIFRQYMVTPYDEGGERRRIACERLVLLLDSLCLRRTKELLDLPGCEDKVVLVNLTEQERRQYESTRSIMDRSMRQSSGLYEHSNSFGIFQAILQLRIFCNHGTFQRHFSWNTVSRRDMREAAISTLGQNSETRCSGCKLLMPVLGSNRIYRIFVEDCVHVLCSECLEDSSGTVDEVGQRHCPLCMRTGTIRKATLPIGIYNSVTTEMRRYVEVSQANNNSEEDDDHYFDWHTGYSSKMEALMRDLREGLNSTKSIIFSCWTRTLNLIVWHLKREGIPFQRIDGEVALKARQTILDEFTAETGKPVLVMTTGTGAFGLNLTAANRVFLVEPQWNPSVENQAIARIIRLGQNTQVLVTRYVVQDSVEKDLLSQQDRKRKIAAIGH